MTRMFPINGKFTPDQRELYTIYVKLYQALMTSIRPGKVRDILQDVVRKMDAVMAEYKFTNPRNQEAADAVRRGVPRAGGVGRPFEPRPHGGHGGPRCDGAVRRAEARHDFHDRAGDHHSRRSACTSAWRT